MRNYSAEPAKSRLKEMSLNTNNMSYMSGKFKPKYGTEKNVNITGIKAFIPIKKVINSKFDLWVEKSETERSMPVKICEKVLSQIQLKLPKILNIPKIIIVDFDKYNINYSAIGGYDPKTGNIFINAKYRSEKSIVKYLSKYKGFFASTDVTAPYLHELGHVYYNTIIRTVADMKKIKYNQAKELIEEPIRKYIYENSKISNEILETELSIYALKGLEKNPV